MCGSWGECERAAAVDEDRRCGGLHDDRLYDQPGTARSESALPSAKDRPRSSLNRLRPGAKSPLLVKSDGMVVQGNTRIKVLEERGYPVDELCGREIVR